MDKRNLINTLREQAINFDIEVQNKLSALMSDDYVFMDVAAYLSRASTPAKSDIDLLQEAFQSDNIQRPSIPTTPSKTEQLAQRLSDIQAKTSPRPTTSSLSDKIAALRGRTLPGSYLMKQ